MRLGAYGVAWPGRQGWGVLAIARCSAASCLLVSGCSGGIGELSAQPGDQFLVGVRPVGHLGEVADGGPDVGGGELGGGLVGPQQGVVEADLGGMQLGQAFGVFLDLLVDLIAGALDRCVLPLSDADADRVV
jgi:hypothetical protein